jgi:hypothetical protein
MYSNSKHSKKDTESIVTLDKGHFSSVKRFLREEINKYTQLLDELEQKENQSTDQASLQELSTQRQ